MTSSTKSKFKVVVDTNVFISGTVFNGYPEKIINLIIDKTVTLVTTAEIELEVFTKLAKFAVEPQKILFLKELFTQGALRVVPKEKIAICRDLKDNKFLEAALVSHADFLISGDKDLLTLKAFHKTQLLTPKNFLSKINK